MLALELVALGVLCAGCATLFVFAMREGQRAELAERESGKGE